MLTFGSYGSDQIDRCIVQIHQSLVSNPTFLNVKIEVIDLECNITGPPTLPVDEVKRRSSRTETLVVFETRSFRNLAWSLLRCSTASELLVHAR